MYSIRSRGDETSPRRDSHQYGVGGSRRGTARDASVEEGWRERERESEADVVGRIGI